MRSIVAAHRALWADRPRFLWTLSFLLSVAGTCAVLGGLASLTAFCNDHPPVGMGAGFKTSPEWARESAEMMRLQKTPVTSSNGEFQCERFFRFEWFLWTFQVVWLMIVGACWYRRTLRRYLPGLIGVGAAITAWHMQRIDFIIQVEQYVDGTMWVRGFMTAGGLITCCIGNFQMMLAGCWYVEHMLPPRGEEGTHGTANNSARTSPLSKSVAATSNGAGAGGLEGAGRVGSAYDNAAFDGNNGGSRPPAGALPMSYTTAAAV